MSDVSELGKITYGFAAALVKEQGQHPDRCLHCKFQRSALEGNGIAMVHEEDCQVNLAIHFLAELNRGLIQS